MVTSSKALLESGLYVTMLKIVNTCTLDKFWGSFVTSIAQQVLPTWSQTTLKKHQGDKRDIKTLQQLEKGETGDEIWDALQHQLNQTGKTIQGHNHILRLSDCLKMQGTRYLAAPNTRSFVNRIGQS